MAEVRSGICCQADKRLYFYEITTCLLAMLFHYWHEGGVRRS